jgi:glutathione S-transferase
MITLTTFDTVPEFVAPLVRAMRVRWALEEAGLPYRVRTVALGPDQRSPDHLARQPFGQVPAIEDDGLVLFESGAIVLHIAGKSEQLLPLDTVGRARAIAWLFAALNSVEVWIQQLAVIDLFHAKEDWAIARRPRLEELVRDRLELMQRALGEKDYLEGRFTVGDLMMGDVLRIIQSSNILEDFPAVQAYKARCEARPAFQRALQSQLEGFSRPA